MSETDMSETTKSQFDETAADKDDPFFGDVGTRRLAAYTMRVKGGASYRDIARAQGVSLRTSYTDVQAVMDYFRKATFESVQDARQMATERLDIALFAVMPAVKRGDLKAISQMLRIEKRRAELLGLDAPTRLEHTGENGGPIETTVNANINIREQWTPQEAAQRAQELIRRMEVVNRENARHQSKAERN